MLHLQGYKLSMDDLKAFRQLDSRTPGHPEAGHTDGIEVTTGPLGQGFANGVGLAIAEAHLAAVYNRDGFDLINNFTYGNNSRHAISPALADNKSAPSVHRRWLSHGGCCERGC